jgi:putative oxidoreductase
MATNSVSALTHRSRNLKALNIATWALQILSALLFLAAGGAKLAGASAMVALFNQIGMGQWFRYFTGGVEVVGAIALLIPQSSYIGAVLLSATMVGAIVARLTVLGGSPAGEIVLLVLNLTVAWKRWPDFLRRFRSPPEIFRTK